MSLCVLLRFGIACLCFFLSWLLWDAACCWATSCLLSSSWPWDHHWPHRVVYGVGTKVSYIYLKCKGKSQPLNPSRPLGVLAVYTNTKSGQEDGGSRVCKFVELLLCGKHIVRLFSLGLCVRISSHFFFLKKVIQNDTESRFWKTQFCDLEPSIWNLDTADLVVLALPGPLAKQQQHQKQPLPKTTPVICNTSCLQETQVHVKTAYVKVIPRPPHPPLVPNDNQSACECCCIIYHSERDDVPEQHSSHVWILFRHRLRLVSETLKLIKPNTVLALCAREPVYTQDSRTDYSLVPHSVVIILFSSWNPSICAFAWR